MSINNFRKIFLSIWFLCQFYSLFSQDYQWWNKKHNWDGVSPWNNYIIYSSKYMGPNALPVPAVNKGKLIDDFEVEAGVYYHYSSGDQTSNIFSKLNLAMVPGVASLTISYVPLEYYSMDTLTRDIRRARNYDPKGIAFGDFYVSSGFQIIKDKENWPDIMINIGIKTASGTELKNARNTDSPGYYFEMSFGKDIHIGGEKLKYYRPYLMGGFFSYQTNLSSNLQNDAVLYGAGIELLYGKVKFNNGIGGYYGYFGNGDRPFVYRLEIESIRLKKLDYRLKLQMGIYDYPYTSMGISFAYNFDRPKWLFSLKNH